MINKMLFLSIFFSFAFIFRIDVIGLSIYFYQICIIVLDILLIINLLQKGTIFINRKTQKLIKICLSFILLGLFSFFGMKFYDDYSFTQYLLGSVLLILEKMTIILLLISSGQNGIKNQMIKYVIVTLKIIMVYGLIQILCFLVNIDINLKIIDLLNLSARGSLNRMGQFFRVSSLTWDTNYLGFYCLLYQFVYIYTDESNNKMNKLFLLLSVFILILTFSKTAYIGFIFILMIYRVSKKIKRRILLKIFILCFLVFVFIFIKYKNIFFPILLSRFGFLIDKSYSSGSNSYRWNLFKLSLQLIATSPIFGIGLNNFSSLMSHATGSSYYKIHNTFLQIGVEQGLISLVLFITFIKKCIFLGKDKSIERLIFIMLLTTNLTYDFLLSFFGYIFLVSIYFYQDNELK